MPTVLVALLVSDGDAQDSALEDMAHLSAPGVDIERCRFASSPGDPSGPRQWTSAGPVGPGVLRAVAIATARSAGFDHVLLASTSARLPENAVRSLVEVASADETIAVTSPWWTQLGEIGLVADGPVPTHDRRDADRISRSLHAVFGTSALDVPLATEACTLLSLRHLDDLGPLDVALDEGGAFEWALRARARGLRSVLAPGCLVGASASGAMSLRLLGADHPIVRHRYPLFEGQLDAVLHSGFIHSLRRTAIVGLARAAAERVGWELVRGDATAGDVPTVVVRDDARATLLVDGFEIDLDGPAGQAAALASDLLGRPPRSASRLDTTSVRT